LIFELTIRLDIRHAFHALALDEHRGPFSPTLWHFPADGDLATRKPVGTHEEIQAAWFKVLEDRDSDKEQISAAWKALVDCETYHELTGTESELLQVWFPGVHINIGGGSDDLLHEWKGDFERKLVLPLSTASADQTSIRNRHHNIRLDVRTGGTIPPA
jgi:hypothetical protein